MATKLYAHAFSQATPPGLEKIERLWLDWTAAAEVAATTEIHLGVIPANRHVAGGLLGITAGGAAATGTVGDGTTADLFGSLTDMTLATVQFIGVTPPTGLGNVDTVDRDLIVTTADAALQSGTTIHGYLDFSMD